MSSNQTRRVTKKEQTSASSEEAAKTTVKPATTESTPEVDDILGDTGGDATATEDQQEVPVVCPLNWRPAGILAAKNNFEHGESIIAAIQFWGPEGDEQWKFLEVTYQQNEVFTTTTGEPYAWHRIMAWIPREEIIPSVDQLKGE